MKKNLFFVTTLLVFCLTAYSQNYTFTNTGNQRNAPYGDQSWNWDTARYKHFYYTSAVDNYKMPYRLLSPPNNDNTKKYPLFIMFHGAGEGIGSACDMTRKPNTCQLNWGGKLALDSSNKYPSYVFFPQTGGGYWGNNGADNAFYGYSDPMAQPTRVVFEIIDNILLQNYNIDPDRIYVAGLSAGGRACWEFLERRPELFAAASPFSGMGNVYLANTLINNPIWNFQGGKDDNPNPFETQNMYDSLVKYGGNPKRSLYVDRDHWAWLDAYQSKTWMQWVYSQDKKNIHVLYGNTPNLCPGDSLAIGVGYGYLQYQWKKDGTDIPGAVNYVYTAKQPGSYTVVAQRMNGTFMTSNPLVITNNNCVVAGQSGLSYSYYEGTYSNLPNFTTAVPKKIGFVNNYTLVPRERELQYAFKFDGYINILTPGQYTFYTNSDDGSKLYIDGVQIVNNDFAQGETERSGTVTLSAGKKAISVTYFQGTGGQTLEVRYEGPGIPKKLIPDAALSYNLSGGNVTPLTSAGPDVSLVLPINSTTITGQAVDADGTISVYTWTKVSGPTATMGGTTTSVLDLNGLLTGVYVFRFTATDNQGATSSDEVTVVVGSGNNILPVADAGADKSITLPVATSTLSGSGTDQDGTIASYGWTKVSGPAATLAGANTATLSLSGLVAGTYVFRLTVTDNLNSSATDDVTLTVNAAVANGLKYSYYQGTYTNLPNFTSLTAVKTGTTTNFALTLRNRETQYAFKFDGYINITAAGQYTFYTKSDDGSKLYINGTQIVNNDFVQGATERSGTVTLAVGKYPISVTYFQATGGQTLEVRYQGPGVTKQLIPNSVLFQSIAPNVPPTANAGIDKTLVLPVNTATLSGTATDSDGSVTGYAWTKVSGPAATLATQNTATLSLSGLVAGVYTFRLTATDNSAATGTDEVIVTVNPANKVPVANAGTDVTITAPASTLTLTGSAADADGSIATYSWTKVSGPAAVLAGNTTSTLSLSGLVTGTYVFRLTATDNNGASGFDDVTVLVNAAPNVLPVANAGIDTNINVPLNNLVLYGTGTDADGTIQAYAWTKVSGPSVTISGALTSSLTLNGFALGTYVFRLTVTDNRGGTATDDISVFVNVAGNLAPAAFAGIDTTLILPVNYINRQGTGTDADGIISTYFWSQIAGPATTIASPAQSTLSLTALTAGVYTFRLAVTDNLGLTSSDDVVITVATANQLPTANAGADKSITLPVSTLSIAGSATDADGTIASYAWTKVSGPAATLSNAGTSTLALSALTAGSYVFRLTVTDNKGGTGSDEVSVVVAPAINKLPVANAGADKSITLPVNSLSIAGSATDADGTIASYAWSKFSGPAATLANATTATVSLSALVAGTYVFRLTVADNSGATATDDVTVTVNPASTACNFGTPLSSGLPTANYTYTKAYVLGQGGPNLSNVSNIAINWNLPQKGLYTLSFNTSNGTPSWYIDLRSVSTNTFGAAAPTITFSKSGITGLDGTYNVGISNGNFIMAEKTGKYTIYCSNAATTPVCSASRMGSEGESLEMMVSPNPASHAVTVSMPEADENVEVTFTSEYGQAYHLAGVLTGEGMEFDINTLSPGIYFVMVKRDGDSEVKKLVIIK